MGAGEFRSGSPKLAFCLCSDSGILNRCATEANHAQPLEIAFQLRSNWRRRCGDKLPSPDFSGI
jgi:hypothetical protein